jgi:serine/threonine-protein kinase
VVLALVLLALAVAGAWAAYAYLLSPGATVPAVVGQRRSDATGALRDEGLKPVLHYVWADKHAKGEVARQAPRGGAKVEDGVKVDLWVSRGPLHIPSPDLTGLAASVARGRLEAESLNSRSRKAASETTPKGQIFRQQPAAGATVERGDTVTFWVSSGPPKVYVPDVVGLSQGDASATLEDAGFVVSTDYVAGWGEIPGTVVGQDPLADVRGRVGDEVVIQVAVF